MSLLEVSHLTKSFPAQRNLLGRTTRYTHAVKDVSFHLDPGETLALVGESGAGKSTVGRLVLRLIKADSGAVTFDGNDVFGLPKRDLRALRRRMQIIFQDPYSSLDPRMSIGDSVAEPLLVHFDMDKSERRKQASDLLERVGLNANDMGKMPQELSGGQLQRAAIARALTLRPSLIVCDEPLSALDVSVRAQVVNLMQDLQSEFGLAYLFVSHDMALVQVIADRVIVMRGGEVVEEGDPETLYKAPASDYTRALLEATPVPIPRPARQGRTPLVAHEG